MNPLPMVLADLRAMRWTPWIVVALIGLAVAIGVAVSAQERALRQGSAHAADDFDLLIGAPGSQTQLVLTAVYLQPEALPLLAGAVLPAILNDKRVAAAAPLAFGDVVQGYPVIGTTVAFATRWGRIKPAGGVMFDSEDQAVIGAGVRLRLGEQVTPLHGPSGHGPSGHGPSGHGHAHAGVNYTVVGRLPWLGSPWDRAILVPVESVWETHGLGDGHAREGAGIGPPFDAAAVPPVPAIVVKPRSVADAYALRAQYRAGGTMALFPAEVLVSAYRVLGDARDVLMVVSALNNLLVFLAVVLLLVTLTGLRRRRHALLRALGASRWYVFLVSWLSGAVLMMIGCVAGLGLGFLAAFGVAWVIEAATGLHLATSADWSDALGVLGLAGIGSLLATIPALLAWRTPPAAGLRG